MTEDFSGSTGSPPLPRFCLLCGSSLVQRFLPNEGHERLVCTACARVHYQNPIVVAGVVLERAGETLLLRREFPPRAGTWIIPGGFVELGETVAQAALRETLDETGVSARLGPILGVYDRPGPGMVLVVYRATILAGEPFAGHEATEVAWFSPDRLPWAALAFDTTEQALQDWVRLQTFPGD